jgi:putative ABC transport system permease protein
VSSAVNVFVSDKLNSAALLRCLGARQRTVLAVYLLQAIGLGTVGAVVGIVLGVLVQALLPAVLRGFLPLDVSVTLHWSTIVTGFGIGVGTATLFALLPLLRLQGVSPLRALRRELDQGARASRGWRLAVYAALAIGLFALSVWQAPRPVVGVAFAVGVIVTTVVLWLTARSLMWATRRWFPRRASYVVRQGIANLFRPMNQTTSVVVAIGFGVFLIATLSVVQRNLLDRLALDARPDRPNLVFFDVQSDQRDGVVRVLAGRGVRALDATPLVPARIARVNGRPIDSLLTDTLPRRSPWALRREYRNTYRDTLVASERLTAGTWWDAARREGDLARISVEEELAAEAGVRVGDRITWNVQGVQVETRIASLRQVGWARFEPNFFVVFEPGVLERAPQTFLLLAREDDATRRAELQRDVVLAYPNVVSLDVTLVRQALDAIVSKVTLAIRFMALFSIGSGLVILVGALAASRLQRIREAVLLKTIGASAAQVRRIFLTEYLAWGSLAALTGVLLAGVAGWALVTQMFELRFRLPTLALFGMWAAVVGLVAAVGLANSRAALSKPPLAVWRELSE